MSQGRRQRSHAAILSDLADTVHGAALDGQVSAWESALEQVADAFRADGAYLQPCGGGETWGPGGPLTARTDPIWGQAYVTHYGALDPVLPIALPRMAPNEALAGWQVFDRAALWRTEYGNDWCRPQAMDETALGLLTRGNSDPDQGWGLLVLWRKTAIGPFERSELRQLEALLPHLRRAVAVGLRLGQTLGARDTLLSALEALAPRGAMLLDQRGRVTFANTAAEAFLNNTAFALERAVDGTLRIKRGMPRHLDRALQQLLSAATGVNGFRSGGSLQFPAVNSGISTSSWMPTIMKVIPLSHDRTLHSLALALLDLPTCNAPSAAEFRTAFGLRPAEARVAELLAMRGLGPSALAAELGISIATARTHLQRLFDKTGTHRQAELVLTLRALAEYH